MRWTALNRDGRPVEGTIPTVGFTESQFRRWLAGQGYTEIEIFGARAARPELTAAEQAGPTGDRRPVRRPAAGVSPAAAPTCAARCLTYNGNHPFDPSPITDADRDEWEFCDRPEGDPVHQQADVDAPTEPLDDVDPPGTDVEPAPRRRRTVEPPGDPDPTRDLTDGQRKLYDDVQALGGYDGADLADVLDRVAGSPEDKAAVADAFGGPGAGAHHRTRDQRIEGREKEREATRAAHRAGDIGYGEYVDRMGKLDDYDDAENTLDVQDRVRETYDRLADAPGDPVSLVDLRGELADVPRPVLDHALSHVGGHGDVHLDPTVGFRRPTEDEQAAALNFGGQPNYAVRIGGENRTVDDLVQHVDKRDRVAADAVLHAVPDDTLPDVADRMGVDHADEPPAEVLRQRIADKSAANHDAWRAEARATEVDGTTLYNADNDLGNVSDWEPEQRDAVREAAERRTGWDWEPGAKRAKRVLAAVREADLADAVDVFGDTLTELDGLGRSAPAEKVVKAERQAHEAMHRLAAATAATFPPGPVSSSSDDVVTRYRDAKARLDAFGTSGPADQVIEAEQAFNDAALALADYAYDNRGR